MVSSFKLICFISAFEKGKRSEGNKSGVHFHYLSTSKNKAGDMIRTTNFQERNGVSQRHLFVNMQFHKSY